MEYSIIACAADGRQLTGSGYNGHQSMHRAVEERIEHHNRGTTVLICIVVVRADGVTFKLEDLRSCSALSALYASKI